MYALFCVTLFKVNLLGTAGFSTDGYVRHDDRLSIVLIFWMVGNDQKYETSI